MGVRVSVRAISRRAQNIIDNTPGTWPGRYDVRSRDGDTAAADGRVARFRSESAARRDDVRTRRVHSVLTMIC